MHILLTFRGPITENVHKAC